MQSFRGGFGGGRGTSSSGYNFYGEHREHEGGSHDYFIGGRGRGGRGGGGFRSRGRRGFGYGSPDKSGDGGRSSFVKKSYSEEVQEQVEQLYNKKFKFHDEFNEWKIPESSLLFCTGPTEPAFQIPKLLELKRNLNATKSKLDNKDMVSWGRHTSFTNRAEVVIRMLRRDFNPELCTHAWAKMQEMLWTFKVVPESMKLNSVHLCEAPGAFITCLNHYLKTHRPDCEWKWKAITLNPYFEGNDHLAMIDQDKFMSETWSHWFVGADNTGDITTWDNLLAFRESVKKDLEEVHLITADGSINCVANPNEQEAMVAQLLYCETVTALALLRQKGSFILKTFTTLEHHTVCLLYIINCCFSEVHVFKPATSKAGNSEQYIICLGYKGRSNVLTHGHLERFRAVYGKRTPPFPFLPLAAVPESFLTQLINCAMKFAKHQIDVIEENVRLYDCMTFSEKQFIIEVKELTCDKFKSRCKLKKLSREKAIVEHLHLDHNHLWVVQSVQGDPLRELFLRRSVESFLTQLEIRRGKAAVDSSPPLHDLGVGEGGPAAKKPRLTMDESSVKAVQHLLNEIGYVATKVGDKLDDPATVAMEMTPDEVQWLKGASSKTHNIHDQIKQLDGCRVIKVTNSRFCRHDVLKSLSEALAKSQIMQASHIDEHEQMASHVTPGHALSVGQPPFFLTRDAVNFAALDYLIGLTGKGDEDRMLLFMDLSGAPSEFSHYLYWRRQHMVKGWGMVRVDNPKLGPGRIMEQLAPWETFQVLGPHSGVDICDNNSIKSLCAGLGNYCPGGVNLVIGDMPPIPFGAHPPGHAEYHSKREFLSQLTCACKILSQGGTFVCRVYELLTRFSAGIVYLMYKLFEEVTILKPITSSPTSPERFVIAKGFHGCQPNVPEALLEVNGHIADLRREAGKVDSEEEGDVLEILPVQLLFEEQFHRFLTLSNERIARHRIKMITLLDRYFAKPELLPDGDEYRELIKRGILEILDLPGNLF